MKPLIPPHVEMQEASDQRRQSEHEKAPGELCAAKRDRDRRRDDRQGARRKKSAPDEDELNESLDLGSVPVWILDQKTVASAFRHRFEELGRQDQRCGKAQLLRPQDACKNGVPYERAGLGS